MNCRRWCTLKSSADGRRCELEMVHVESLCRGSRPELGARLLNVAIRTLWARDKCSCCNREHW